MVELHEVLKASWGGELLLQEGWNKLTPTEKEEIKTRVDGLFKHDQLPFELKYPKHLYIYTFATLAQLELLGIQVPYNFESQLTSPKLRVMMRRQLIDELFHCIVFSKILYILCAPYAIPPAHNSGIEKLFEFVRQEKCQRTALMILNLLGEGWIEEFFIILQKQDVAPELFKIILEDEKRHLSEADLYRDIGLPPDKDVLQSKMAFMEEQLLFNIFMREHNSFALCTILGVKATLEFITALNKKHVKQLRKINLKPSKNWQHYMKIIKGMTPQIQHFSNIAHEVEMTPMRKLLMTQWSNPSDPTMVAMFNLNVTCLDFFNKKFPSDTLTLLILQTISCGLYHNPQYRYFLNQGKLFQTKEAYVAIVVKLPECRDHIATVIFENPHTLTVQELSNKIKTIMRLMVLCYQTREALEKKHPYLKHMADNTLYAHANDIYKHPIPAEFIVTLSNVGHYGYCQAKSPLRYAEALKFNIFQVERRPVWNHEKQAFEPQDILPVAASADHRIFDGNIHMPKLMAGDFDLMFKKMLADIQKPAKKLKSIDENDFLKTLNYLIDLNVETAYKALNLLHSYWYDYLGIDQMLSMDVRQNAASAFKGFVLDQSLS